MFENIQQRWTDAGKGARTGFVISLLAITVFFALAVYWATRTEYQVLFSELDPSDASTIVSELERMKVGYRLEDGGKTILVDQDAVYRTRLKLMGKGVNLRGTVGFEIFNNTDFGTTEFAQKINYQRALQGELARTIMDFEEIQFARVHLVLPESGLFKKNNVKPKASISLILKGGRQLNPEQVAGIQRLVAASVPEIQPASVTVLDQRGVALTRALGSDGDMDSSDARLDTKKQVETYLTRKIVDMLDKALGAGQAIVSVDVALSHDHVKVTREDVIPLSKANGESAGSVVRRRQSQQSPVASADALPPIAASADGSVPALPAAPVRRGSGTLEIEYANGRQVEQTVSTPGSIERISVGVLLPDSLPADRHDSIREVVAMAAGVQPERGDSIAIYSIGPTVNLQPAMLPDQQAGLPLDEQFGKPAAPQPEVISQLAMLLAAILTAVGVVVLLILRDRKRQPEIVQPRLSEAQRLEALTHVRRWIDGQTTVSNAEVKA